MEDIGQCGAHIYTCKSCLSSIPPESITDGLLLQSEVDSTRESSGDKSPGQQSLGGQHHRQGALQRAEAAVDSTFQLAAQYIALAQALQPGKEVYRTSLQASAPIRCYA